MISQKRACAVLLLSAIWLVPVLGVSAGEKEELDEILRYDSQQIQAIERNGTADIRAAADAVIRRYRSFIRKYPGNADARNYLGGLYYDLGRPADAVREWKSGLRINPRDPYLHNNIAEYYGHDSGEPEKAIAETRKAIGLKPDVAVFHFNLATYYDAFRFVVLPEFESPENVFAACLKEYRNAIGLDPANFEYASVYARTLTYGPKIWGIADPYPVPEKIAAWEYCLPRAPDPQQEKFILKEIEKLRSRNQVSAPVDLPGFVEISGFPYG